MKTPADREAAFRMDLADLLLKHGATMNIGDDGKPYGMHTGVVTITMYSMWDDEGNQTADFSEFRI